MGFYGAGTSSPPLPHLVKIGTPLPSPHSPPLRVTSMDTSLNGFFLLSLPSPSRTYPSQIHALKELKSRGYSYHPYKFRTCLVFAFIFYFYFFFPIVKTGIVNRILCSSMLTLELGNLGLGAIHHIIFSNPMI